jgi:hypothetical protein
MLCFETLEDRSLLSATPGIVASAKSTLGGQDVQFDLQSNGNLLMIQGTVQTNIGSGVSGLYQGTDTAGDSVAFKLVAGQLSEFTPNGGWVSISAANQVLQGIDDNVMFTHAGELSLLTGVATAGAQGAIPLLTDVKSLTAKAGQAVVQVGSYLQATLGAQLDPSGGATLTLSNVQVDLGAILSGLHSSLSNQLSEITKVAEQLVAPIPSLPSWTSQIGLNNVTIEEALTFMGYSEQAQEIQSLATEVNSVNALTADLKGNGWVEVTNGSLTAQITAGQLPSGVTGQLNAPAALLSTIGLNLSSLSDIGLSLPALQNPGQLVELLMGDNVALVNFALSLDMTEVSFNLPLADFPTPIPASDVQIGLAVSASAGCNALVSINSVGLFSGNLAQSLTIQDYHTTASVDFGLSGTYWEALVIGYQVTGEIGIQATDSGGLSVSKGVTQAVVSPFASTTTLAQFIQSVSDIFPTNDPNVTSAVLVNVVQGLSGQWKTAPATIAKTLGSITQNYAAIGYALGKGLPSYVGLSGVVNALQAGGADALQVADGAASMLKNVLGDGGLASVKALQNLNVNVPDIAAALSSVFSETIPGIASLLNQAGVSLPNIAGALSSLDNSVSDVVAALSAEVNNVGQVASAIWHDWDNSVSLGLTGLSNALWHDWKGATSFNLNNLGGALSSLDSSVSDVVAALSSEVNNVGQVASAIWHDWDNSVTLGLTGLSNALWQDWKGATSFNLNSLGGALSSLDNSVSDVVAALSSEVNNVGQVASAIWHDWDNSVTLGLTGLSNALWQDWKGATSFNLNSLGGALSSLDSSVSDVVAALSSDVNDVGQVASAIWHDWDNSVTLGLTGLSNALWHDWKGATSFNLNNLGGALSSLDSSVSDVVAALSSDVNDVGQVASAIWHDWDTSVALNLTGLSNALWHDWKGATSFNLNNLGGALSSLDSSVSDVVAALSSDVNDVGQVASAIWHDWDTSVALNLTGLSNALWHDWKGATSFNLNNLGGALSSLDSSVSDVVAALSADVNDVGQVASAIWHDWDTSVALSLTGLSNALWHDWNGATSFNLNNLAGALSSIDDSLGDVVAALGAEVNNAGQVASAVWHNWENNVNWSPANLINVLASDFSISFLQAESIVYGL